MILGELFSPHGRHRVSRSTRYDSIKRQEFQQGRDSITTGPRLSLRVIVEYISFPSFFVRKEAIKKKSDDIWQSGVCACLAAVAVRRRRRRWWWPGTRETHGAGDLRGFDN